MVVAFNETPGNLRVPFFYAEINAGGTPFNSASRLLLIGQKLAAGSATADEPVLVSGNVAEDYFGAGSMLASMVATARLNAPFQEVWALPVEDDAAAVAAVWTLTLAAGSFPVSSSTTYVIYVGGRRYRVSVGTADTNATLATAIAAEINDDEGRFVNAAVAANVVTLTARNDGAVGNTIDIRTKVYGDEPSIATTATTIAQTVTGATNPDLTAALAALNDEEFDWIVTPYSDSANLALYRSLMDGVSGRWSPYKQLYGHVFTVSEGTVGTLSALGLTLNDPHLTMIGYNDSPSPSWTWVAAWGAQAAKNLSTPPNLSRPLQFLTLSGVLAPKIASRFSMTDRNTLLYDGIATWRVADDGSVQIERSITTYQQNSLGFADATFLDVQSLAQAQYTARYLRQKVSNNHGRHALADDDAPVIQFVSRPRDIRNTLIAGYNELVNLAVVENPDVFEQALIVERDATDANRVNVYLPFDVVNQLRVVAVNATLFVQYPENI